MIYIDAAIPVDRKMASIPKLAVKFAVKIPAPRAGAIGDALKFM